MKNLKLAVFAAFGLVSMSAGSAFAQSNDSDAVSVTAEVVSDMSVTAGSAINLGQLFRSSADTVAADGSNSKFPSAARFDIEGPNALTWRLTLAYQDLAGPSTQVISIGAPAGS